MKVLVTGAIGMLGKEVVKKAKGVGLDVAARSHADLDITNDKQFEVELNSIRPDIVINCAGIVRGRTNVKEQDFRIVNGVAPVLMARICNHMGVRMVQVSTDCVFDGKKTHTESDKPNARDIYGLSKIEGEVHHGRHLVIRCSFVGLGSRGLLAWLQQEQGDVFGFRKVKWNGLTAPYAAQAIVDFAITEVHGIVHIFGKDTTKYDVLVAANKVLNLKKKIKSANTPAADYRLRTAKPYHIFVPKIEDQIKEMADAYRSDPSRS